MRSACGAPHHSLRSNSGSFAIFAAIRRASFIHEPGRSFVMMVHRPVQDDPHRFLALVARLALAVMTLLVARAILALASAMTFVVLLALASAMALLVVSAVFVLGPAIKLPVLCWRY
jgi:hypothetical protein